MHEIEVKILEIDPDAIASKLTQALGFEEKPGGMYRAVYMDTPAGELAKSGKILRLRQEGSKAVLAYKKNISRDGAKIMEEHQTALSDFEAALRILRGLGYMPLSETAKTRRIFQKDRVEVVIDDYLGELAHIPPFLEIEAPDEKTIHSVIIALGFSEDQALSWDTSDLVRHYGQ
ncbi:MAG: class IV adenylate cyclase [Bacteroidia bacterium]